MRGAVLRRLGLALIATLALALLALNVLAWTGGLVDEESGPAEESVLTTPAPPAEPTITQETAGTQAEPISQTPTRRKPQQRAPSQGIALVLTASRGDCWVEARAGSATGAVLYAGTLANGGSLRFSRPRIWLRLGAASNVDLEINGRPSTIPSGTVELVVPDA